MGQVSDAQPSGRHRRRTVGMIPCGIALLASAFSVPCTAQEHAPSAFYADLGEKQASDSRALIMQAKALIGRHDKLAVGDFSTTCARLREEPANSTVRVGADPIAALALAVLEARAPLDSALARLDQVADRGAGPEAMFLRASALASWQEPADLTHCRAHLRSAEAAAQLEELRAMYPTYRAADAESLLAVMRTRAGEFEQAAAAYRRAIALNLEAADTSTLTANLGEVTMLTGDLEEALVAYQRALRLALNSRDRALALWGKAVVLERLGEHQDAVRDAGKAMALEGGEMRVLRAAGVFFQPEFEIHQYEALGHEARALAIPGFAPIALQEAEESLQAYLRGAAESESAFSPTARRSLKNIQERLAASLADAITLP